MGYGRYVGLWHFWGGLVYFQPNCFEVREGVGGVEVRDRGEGEGRVVLVAEAVVGSEEGRVVAAVAVVDELL